MGDQAGRSTITRHADNVQGRRIIGLTSGIIWTEFIQERPDRKAGLRGNTEIEREAMERRRTFDALEKLADDVITMALNGLHVPR